MSGGRPVSRRTVLRGLGLAGLGAAAGCGTGSDETVRVAVVWSGAELRAFRRAVDDFTAAFPYRVSVVSLGDNAEALLRGGLASAVAPDVAILPQPTLIGDGSRLVDLSPGSFTPDLTVPYRPDSLWATLAADRDGRRRGVWYKATHKSLVWYRKDVFEDNGLTAPLDWKGWHEVCTSEAAGRIAPLALGAADGWVLTDWFENMLLGRDPDLLAPDLAAEGWPKHEDTVRAALTDLAELFWQPAWLHGGTDRALLLQFGDSVLDVMARGRALMVAGADFTYTVARRFARRRLDVLSLLIPLLTVLSALSVAFSQDLMKDHLPRPVFYAVIFSGGAATAVLLLLRRRSRHLDPDREPDAPLPPRVELVGRDELVAEATDLLRRAHLLLLHGPRNIGTSAVALEVAFRVVPDESAHVYVDLRSRQADRQEDAPGTQLRVLTALGLKPRPGGTAADVREQVRRALTGTGRVLVLDNVRSADQIGWVALPVLGAYVLVAGDVTPPRGVPDLPVEPLAPDGGLALLRRGPLGRRLSEDYPDVRRLADNYLRSPAVVLAVGAWLEARPTATVAELLDELAGRGDLDRTEPSRMLRTVLRLQADGLSPDAAALFALVPSIPVTFVGVGAVAALLNRPPQRAERALDELARRALVDAEAGRYRIPGESRRLGQTVRLRTLRAASARLLTWYADAATARVGVLRDGPDAEPERAADARDWLEREQGALLALLDAARRHPMPASAARPAAAIADVLDVWFAEQRLPEEREKAATAALAAAHALGDRAGAQTALLRLAVVTRILGRLDEAADMLARVRSGGLAGPAAEARLAAASGALSLATGDLASARLDV